MKIWFSKLLHAIAFRLCPKACEESHQRTKDEGSIGQSGVWANAEPKTKEINASILVRLMGIQNSADFLANEHGLHTNLGFARARKRCMDRMSDMIGEHFSDQDIQGLVEFYSSPLGTRFAEKQAETFKHFGDIIQAFIHEAMEES